MPEPYVRYVRTSDGVSIACSVAGDGLPFVAPPPAMPWGHIQLGRALREWRDWSDRIADRMRLVRDDGRGAGRSEREIDDVSLEANVRDLEAVVDGLALERIALFGCYFASPVAIAYAERHPERASHLVLWCGFASTAEARGDGQRAAALRQLVD
ncbi:MAG: alpha/beta fold hydrolase [Dehalococcoidia bacterium]|nr:alpha/beta fold hydrolase [Dehalococcoidia bacterium]